jgi:hypothetical protein
MELPALFYGLYRDVKRRMSRIVTQMRKGADWIALVEAEGFLDTATTPGFILLEGPSPLVGGQAHFQQWLLWTQYRDKQADEWVRGREDVHAQDEQAEEVFHQSLTRPWSTLGLVSGQNTGWFIPKHRYRPFLHAVRRYWDLFDSVGPRYSAGLQTPVPLWSLPNSIKYVLANLGMSNEEMDPPWPPGGLPEIIERTERHLH